MGFSRKVSDTEVDFDEEGRERNVTTERFEGVTHFYLQAVLGFSVAGLIAPKKIRGGHGHMRYGVAPFYRLQY